MSQNDVMSDIDVSSLAKEHSEALDEKQRESVDEWVNRFTGHGRKESQAVSLSEIPSTSVENAMADSIGSESTSQSNSGGRE